MATFEIAPGRYIGGDNPCFVIAEIGQNHQGEIRIAKDMIKMAKDCGADCAKFQKCRLDKKFNSHALKRPYHSQHAWGKTYGEHKAYLEFSDDEFRELQRYANEASIDFLDSIGLPFLKIASPDCGNINFVKYAASKGKPLIISTGTQDMDTVRSVYKDIKDTNKKFALLHCTSTYPTLPEDAHLKVLKAEFPESPIGYSSHEQGTAISIAAVAMGAKVIERHVTLNKTWKGNDHTASLEPHELKSLIESIRIVEKALGTTEKRIRKSEEPFVEKLGKTLVATKDLMAGHVIKEDDVIGKVAEPKGVRIVDMKDIIGLTLSSHVKEDESITLKQLEPIVN